LENASDIISAAGGGNIWSILAILASGAMGKYAWDFYKKKATLNHKERDEQRKDQKQERLLDRKEKNEFKDDLKDRIESLETRLDAALKAKEELMVQIGDLKAKLAKIETKLEMILENSKIHRTEEQEEPSASKRRTRKNA